MIELELFVVFFASIFFTLLYVGRRELLWGAITFGCWQVVGFLWTRIDPMSSTYSVAILFHSIGILFGLMVVLQWLSAFKNRNLEPSELD